MTRSNVAKSATWAPAFNATISAISLPLLANLARQYRPGRLTQQGGGNLPYCRCKQVRVVYIALRGDEQSIEVDRCMVTYTYALLQSMIYNLLTLRLSPRLTEFLVISIFRFFLKQELSYVFFHFRKSAHTQVTFSQNNERGAFTLIELLL